MTVDTLKAHGLTIYEAQDADEAIRILENNTGIAVVFTDINMPGSMDGIRLAHSVRDRWPPIRFIVTSGQAKPKSSDLPSGTHFLSKPYSSDNVARKIIAMVDSSPI